MTRTGWVLVAGASRGIGLATARLLLREGYAVVASARGGEENFRDAPQDRLRFLPFDFNDIEALPDYAARVAELTGGVSGMLYAAGMQKTLPLVQSKPQIAGEIFRLNAFAVFELVRLFAKKGFYSPDGASFVLISSLAAHEGALGKALYAASKGALEGFIPPAAAELAPRKIRINAVAPGVVRTDMSMEFIDKMSVDRKRALENSYPLGLGEPEDIAELIVWLLSKKARWVTGQTFFPDGGHSIRGE